MKASELRPGQFFEVTDSHVLGSRTERFQAIHHPACSCAAITRNFGFCAFPPETEVTTNVPQSWDASPQCENSWTDARNEVIASGEVCLKCGSMRAGNEPQYIDHITSALAEIAQLKTIKFRRFANEDCWIYQGDGEDHLESLVCPVVVSPQKLMEFERLSTDNDRLRELLRECELFLPDPDTRHLTVRYTDTGLRKRVREALK